jgi:hypothetical protein
LAISLVVTGGKLPPRYTARALGNTKSLLSQPSPPVEERENPSRVLDVFMA